MDELDFKNVKLALDGHAHQGVIGGSAWALACLTCGALVMDKELHISWHATIKKS